MDLIEAHALRLPAVDERWTPRPYERDDLILGLLEGRVAGMVSHPLDNVRRHIDQLLDGDPDKQFGLTGLQDRSFGEVLELVAAASGFTAERDAFFGPVSVDPDLVLESCHEVGERLAWACRRQERVVLATGHPVGLMLLYVEVGRLLAANGADVIRPADGLRWKEWKHPGRRHHTWQIRYLHHVAMLTDGTSATHTHGGGPMLRMLEEMRPDLVFADHGFAGAAIEAGIDTVSIADVNDPALIVARAQGRCGPVVVMDDNVQPDAYWPCFQEIAAGMT